MCHLSTPALAPARIMITFADLLYRVFFFIFSYKREGNLNNDKNNKIKCLYPWILGVSSFLSCL